MKELYLQVMFRKGYPIAAYLYLPRQAGEKSYRTAKVGPCIIIDFAQSGQPIGIEITAPAMVTAASINRVLKDLGVPQINHAELAPLQAA